MSSSKARGGRAAAIFGALAVLTIPVDVAIAQYVNGVELLKSLYVAVPVAAVFALTALTASRRARFARARSVYATDGRWGARLAWAGLYCAVTGAIALAIYGGLRASE
ncbi:MAG: hypothetical protein QOH16_1699 [Gaiellaceae bacterium]|jgi:hypothetical protein|nr:hypothetical protein [Gaiellaceae bacterium]